MVSGDSKRSQLATDHSPLTNPINGGRTGFLPVLPVIRSTEAYVFPGDESRPWDPGPRTARVACGNYWCIASVERYPCPRAQRAGRRSSRKRSDSILIGAWHVAKPVGLSPMLSVVREGFTQKRS